MIEREKNEIESIEREISVEEEREKRNKIILSHFVIVFRIVSYLRRYCSNVA